MSRPVLYSFRRCPYAMRGRMALTISQQTVELREVLLRDKPPSMIEASSKGTVPVLVEENGQVVDESLDLMFWALERGDPEDWLGPDMVSQRALIAENDGEFKHHLDRYKYATRYDDVDPREHRDAGFAYLQKLDRRLSQSGQLFRHTRAMADVAIFPFVRQFRIADPDWFDVDAPANVRRWLTEHIESDLFQSVMTKYDVWKEGETGVAFP